MVKKMDQVPKVPKKGGNTNPPSRNRKYCLTLNNYDDNEYNALFTFCSAQDFYIIGKEKGKNETPHLQVYVENKNKISFNVLKAIVPRSHIEIARGTQKDNYEYCSKDGDFKSNIIIKKDVKKAPWVDYELSLWEGDILTKIDNIPDYRTIVWVYDADGNKGKTRFCNYLLRKFNGIYFTGGKNSDIISQILLYNKNNGDIPGLFLFDLPRSNEGKISYNALEQIKNGMVNSGKYEGGFLQFDVPHVIVMSNFEPDYEALSQDRWNVITI